MSAIAAIFQTNGAPAVGIDRLMSALRDHGPDKTVTKTYGHVALGFGQFTATREDIGQVQPITGAGGRLSMVFDGRLDNRPDLAADLAISAADLRLLSDGDLAMRSWERWGQDALDRWVGSFAAIIFDQPTGRLLAFGDHLASRTLFHHVGPDRVAIASTAKALHALPDIPRDLDDRKLADMMFDSHPEPERTFFQNIHRIRPGHILTVDQAGVRQQRFYDLAQAIKPIQLAGDQDYVDAASDLFATISAQYMRSPGPVGAFLSGGLDSSTVAIHAARHLAPDQRLQTYTSVPEPGWDGITDTNAYGDETPYVQAIADANPALSLNLVDAAGLGVFHRMDQLLRIADGPIRNSLNMIWYHEILDRARTDGMRVMLQGTMGNITLSYDGQGLFDQLARQRRFATLARELWAASPTLGTFARLATRTMLPDRAVQLIDRFRRRNTAAPRPSVMAPAFADLHQVAQRRRARVKVTDATARAIDVLTRYQLPAQADADRALGALYGIDLRDPMADRRLVEWRLGVPEDQFMRLGQSRWLIKRMMTGLLPDTVLHKPVPLGRQSADWHVRLTRDLPEIRTRLETLRNDPEAARMLDLDRIENLLSDWPNQTITQTDPRRLDLSLALPLALQVAAFSRQVRGVNR